mgnify:FL=1
MREEEALENCVFYDFYNAWVFSHHPIRLYLPMPLYKKLHFVPYTLKYVIVYGVWKLCVFSHFFIFYMLARVFFPPSFPHKKMYLSAFFTLKPCTIFLVLAWFSNE